MFLQMMVKLKNEGFINDNDQNDSESSKNSSKLTFEEVVAQGFK